MARRPKHSRWRTQTLDYVGPPILVGPTPPRHGARDSLVADSLTARVRCTATPRTPLSAVCTPLHRPRSEQRSPCPRSAEERHRCCRTCSVQLSACHSVDELELQKVALARKCDPVASLRRLIIARQRIGYRLSRVGIGEYSAGLEGDVDTISRHVRHYLTCPCHEKLFEFMVAIVLFCRQNPDKDQVLAELQPGPSTSRE